MNTNETQAKAYQSSIIKMLNNPPEGKRAVIVISDAEIIVTREVKLTNGEDLKVEGLFKARDIEREIITRNTEIVLPIAEIKLVYFINPSIFRQD